jgi:hypothetical protein
VTPDELASRARADADARVAADRARADQARADHARAAQSRAEADRASFAAEQDARAAAARDATRADLETRLRTHQRHVEAGRAADRLAAHVGHREHEQSQKEQFIAQGRAELARWWADRRRR